MAAWPSCVLTSGVRSLGLNSNTQTFKILDLEVHFLPKTLFHFSLFFIKICPLIKICPRAPLRAQTYQKMRPHKKKRSRFRIGSSRCVSNLLRSGGNTCACVTFPSTRCGTLTRFNESRFGKRILIVPMFLGNCPPAVDHVGFPKCHSQSYFSLQVLKNIAQIKISVEFRVLV